MVSVKSLKYLYEKKKNIHKELRNVSNNKIELLIYNLNNLCNDKIIKHRFSNVLSDVQYYKLYNKLQNMINMINSKSELINFIASIKYFGIKSFTSILNIEYYIEDILDNNISITNNIIHDVIYKVNKKIKDFDLQNIKNVGFIRESYIKNKFNNYYLKTMKAINLFNELTNCTSVNTAISYDVLVFLINNKYITII
jgi:hypothetical protein